VHPEIHMEIFGLARLPEACTAGIFRRTWRSNGSIPTTKRSATSAGSGRSRRPTRSLSDPEKRARFDINYERHRRNRWRLVSTGAQAESDFEMEQMIRLTLLEALYTKRRIDPESPSIYSTELEIIVEGDRLNRDSGNYRNDVLWRLLPSSDTD
jgi:hypothetical protein